MSEPAEWASEQRIEPASAEPPIVRDVKFDRVSHAIFLRTTPFVIVAIAELALRLKGLGLFPSTLYVPVKAH